MSKPLTVEEKKAKIRDLRPIDDVFFEVLARNKAVCQEILRTILEDDALIVEEVIPQDSERNIYGRSVRLDVLCVLADGTRCNVEVQRSDNDNHLRRVRFNASSITVKDSNVGDKFQNVVEVYVVYISSFDIFGDGHTIYHIDKVIRETGRVADDGLHEIFVNTVHNDGTKIADLMSCFMKTELQSADFPELSREVTRLKTTEGGASAVCAVMQKYEDAARKEGRLDMLFEMVTDGIISEADAAKKAQMTETEFRTAYMAAGLKA